MKAQFESILEAKGLTVGNLSAKMQKNCNQYYDVTEQLSELEAEEGEDYDDEQIEEIKEALNDLDAEICKYLGNYEKNQDKGRKLQEARTAKKAANGGSVKQVVNVQQTQQAAPIVEQQQPIVEETPQQAPKEEKKGIGWGAIIGGVFGVAALTFLGISINRGTFPFKRR